MNGPAASGGQGAGHRPRAVTACNLQASCSVSSQTERAADRRRHRHQVSVDPGGGAGRTSERYFRPAAPVTSHNVTSPAKAALASRPRGDNHSGRPGFNLAPARSGDTGADCPERARRQFRSATPSLGRSRRSEQSLSDARNMPLHLPSAPRSSPSDATRPAAPPSQFVPVRRRQRSSPVPRRSGWPGSFFGSLVAPLADSGASA